MQVSRWGNSLAVRLPAAVVEALGLEKALARMIFIASCKRSRFLATKIVGPTGTKVVGPTSTACR